MKKVIQFLLILFLIIPMIANAGTYSAEVGKANGLLNKENYVHTYEKYIVHGSNIKFEYSNGTNKVNTSFTKGGFISLEEFNLTKKNNVSYLFEGIEFWTLSRNGNNVYAVTYGDTNTPKNPELSYSGRATEFVNPNVTIKGKGTLSNPWTFDAMFKVSAVVDNRYATIESGNNVYVRGGCTNADCTANIVITPKTGFRYIANDCDGQYDEANHILSVNNVKRDTTCNVSFGKGLFTITLTGGTPNKIYLKHGENFYKESATKTIIRKIDSVSPRTGYTFIGYFYNSHKIINGVKETQIDDNLKIPYESVTGKYIISDVTLDPTYEANQYKVIFNCNGGSNPPTTQLIIYDQQFTITSSVCRRAGYIQPSWNTKSDGTGDTWTVANHTDVKWQIANDVTLYAIWSACPAGTYNAGTGSNTCTGCAAGTYNTGTGNTSCTACVAGTYNTGTGNTTCTACAAGTYNTGTGNTTCTACPAGKYNTGTGNTSCSNCSAGTFNVGTGNTSCTACAKGSYSAAGASSCTVCGAGKTTTSTGSTSSNCKNCASITGLATWATPSWTNNTVSNLCGVGSCDNHYRNDSTTCTYLCDNPTKSTTGCGGWGGWSNCSKSCGTGTQSHSRTCPTMSTIETSHQCGTWKQTANQNCNTRDCCSSTHNDCPSTWSTCSKSCGGGTQTRTCTKISDYDGSDCGTFTDRQNCNTQACCCPNGGYHSGDYCYTGATPSVNSAGCYATGHYWLDTTCYSDRYADSC